MGHVITGLVAAPPLLADMAHRHRLPSPALLAQGLAFLPLRDIDLDAFLSPPLDGTPEGFSSLSAPLIDYLLTLSLKGPVAYVETDYFAGTGSQGAAVFRDGHLAMQPVTAHTGPINLALAFLGVKARHEQEDEFEAVGLNRFRHTEEWIAATGEQPEIPEPSAGAQQKA